MSSLGMILHNHDVTTLSHPLTPNCAALVLSPREVDAKEDGQEDKIDEEDGNDIATVTLDLGDEALQDQARTSVC